MTSASEGQSEASAGQQENDAEQDSREELQRLASELREVTLHVAWRQWRTLGAGAAGRSGARTVAFPDGSAGHQLRALIDPEALVLISLVLLPHERRLADLLHDWGARNSDLLSVQRMNNLKVDYSDQVRVFLDRGLRWFATVARDAGKDLRWRSMSQARDVSGTVSGEGETSTPPLEESNVRQDGASRAKQGETSQPKTRATRARLTTTAALLLRLRLGVGVGVKADLLAFLLARVEEWATVRDIADATAYTVSAVRRAAEDLAAARLVEALEGQPTSYRVAYDAWAPLLGLEDRPPRWASWHERFVFVTAFSQWAEESRQHPLSHYAFGAHGRYLLEQHRPVFDRDSIAVWSAHSVVQDWAGFFKQSVHALALRMEEMA